MFVPEYESRESKYKSRGTFEDLREEGMVVYPASRGVPTIEIESTRPFFLRYVSKEENGKSYTVFSMFRKYRRCEYDDDFRVKRGIPKRDSDNWFVALTGYNYPEDDCDFEVIFLQRDSESIAPFWTSKGKDTITSLLDPFINEHDDFNGYVIGVREGSLSKNADLSTSDLSVLTQSTETVSELANKYDINHVAIQYHNQQSGVIEYALLNLETMMVTHNSKPIEIKES